MRFSVFILCLAFAATCYAHGWGKSKGSSWFKGWGGKSKDSSEEKGAGAGAGRRSGSHGSSSSEESSEENNGGNAGGAGAGAGTGSRDDFVKGWSKRGRGHGHWKKCLGALADEKCSALINAFGQSEACADEFVAKACAGPCAAPAPTTTTVPTTTTTACDNRVQALPYFKAFHENFGQTESFYYDSYNCTLSHTVHYRRDGSPYAITGRDFNVLNNNPQLCACIRLYDEMRSIQHECKDVMPCEDPDSYMDYVAEAP